MGPLASESPKSAPRRAVGFLIAPFAGFSLTAVATKKFESPRNLWFCGLAFRPVSLFPSHFEVPVLFYVLLQADAIHATPCCSARCCVGAGDACSAALLIFREYLRKPCRHAAVFD